MEESSPIITSESTQTFLPSPLVEKGKGEGGVPGPVKVQVQETYGKLPLYFIQNDGQVDEKVKFYEKGSGHAIYFTKEGVYISLIGKKEATGSSEQVVSEKRRDRPSGLSAQIPSPLVREGQGGGNPDLIKLTFLNANPDPEIITEGLQEGKVNYFIGNDPKKWKTNISTYKAVLYKEVYPGIDIKFYGNNRQMEYDIIVKPGADPSQVRFAYEGIEGLRVTENDDLEIILHPPSPLAGEGRGEGNKIIQKKPVIYQEIGGKRVAVEGCFRIQDSTVIASEAKQSSFPTILMEEGKVGVTMKNSQFTYTFEVASYDKSHSLIIDPVLEYSSYLGSDGSESAQDVIVDASGDVYIVGYVSGYTDPLELSGVSGVVPAGGVALGSRDIFIAKIDGYEPHGSVGHSVLFVTYLGGSDYEGIGGPVHIALGDNSIYITGETLSPDFPTTPGAAQQSFVGGLSNIYNTGPAKDGFVLKLDMTGSNLLYSTYLGGDADDEPSGIVVDASGNAYVAGWTVSSDADVSDNLFPLVEPIPGAGVLDSDFGGGHGPLTNQCFWTDPLEGTVEGFLTKIDPTGSSILFSTYLGGTRCDSVMDIAIDNSGDIYLLMNTLNSGLPVIGGSLIQPGGYAGPEYFDVYVAKIDGNGESILFSFYLGGTGNDMAYSFSVTPDGSKMYITGTTNSIDFPGTAGSPIQSSRSDNTDSFVSGIDLVAPSIIFSTYWAGWNVDQVYDIAIDGVTGNPYIVGYTNTSQTDIEPFPLKNPLQPTLGGSFDAFISGFKADGTDVIFSTYLGGVGSEVARGIASGPFGKLWIVGETYSDDFLTADPNQPNRVPGGSDAFVTKISLLAELPRTGQTTCYDSAGAVIPCAGTGQDGRFRPVCHGPILDL